jgi:acetyl-CoA synthase
MSRVLKETMAEEFAAVAEREGDPDLINKVADESVCTEVDDLLVHLETVGHPAMTMDMMF